MKIGGILVLLIDIGGPIIIVIIVIKVMEAAPQLGRVMRGANGARQGIVGAARKRAQGTSLYQIPRMARAQREAERQRSATEKYAQRVTGEGWRGASLRRRAGGGSAAAQNRAYVSGLGAIEKLESQETKDAAFVIEHNKISDPTQLARLAAGEEATGATGQTVSGAGNEAIRLAAIRKIISAQDAGAIQTMFMDDKVDKGVLVGELQKESNFSNVKGAGAHLVAMEARTYSPQEIEDEAVKAMGTLSAAKLAAQDGPAMQSALAGFTRLGSGAGDPTTLKQRQELWRQAYEIYSNPQTLNTVKPKTRVELDKIFAAPPPGSPPGTAPTILVGQPIV